jgi:hypothetical protein
LILSDNGIDEYHLKSFIFIDVEGLRITGRMAFPSMTRLSSVKNSTVSNKRHSATALQNDAYSKPTDFCRGYLGDDKARQYQPSIYEPKSLAMLISSPRLPRAAYLAGTLPDVSGATMKKKTTK